MLLGGACESKIMEVISLLCVQVLDLGVAPQQHQPSAAATDARRGRADADAVAGARERTRAGG